MVCSPFRIILRLGNRYFLNWDIDDFYAHWYCGCSDFIEPVSSHALINIVFVNFVPISKASVQYYRKCIFYSKMNVSISIGVLEGVKPRFRNNNIHLFESGNKSTSNNFFEMNVSIDGISSVDFAIKDLPLVFLTSVTYNWNKASDFYCTRQV